MNISKFRLKIDLRLDEGKLIFVHMSMHIFVHSKPTFHLWQSQMKSKNVYCDISC